MELQCTVKISAHLVLMCLY